MATTSLFNRGDAVKFTTKTRKGSGVVKAVNKTVKGDWFLIKAADDSEIKLRAAALRAA